MDGVGFLAEAMDIHPQAKRALLTAYADTNAAIDAINEARVHYYLMKPGIRRKKSCSRRSTICFTIGLRNFVRRTKAFASWARAGLRAPTSCAIFSARNQVPYQWIDVELAATDPEVRRLIESLGPEAETLPLILFPDGERFAEPPFPAVAQTKSACTLTRRRTSTISLSSAAVPRVSPPRCTALPKACAR